MNEDVTAFAEVRRDLADIIRRVSVARDSFVTLLQRLDEPTCYEPLFDDIVRELKMLVADLDYVEEHVK